MGQRSQGRLILKGKSAGLAGQAPGGGPGVSQSQAAGERPPQSASTRGESQPSATAADSLKRYQERLEGGEEKARQEIRADKDRDVAQADTGLRSVDLEMPSRGTVFLFTTPGGETQITARTVSRETSAKALQLAALAAVVLLALALIRFAARGGFRRFDRRASIVLLLIAGFLTLLVGLVVLALVLLVAGLLLAIRLLAARTLPQNPVPTP